MVNVNTVKFFSLLQRFFTFVSIFFCCASIIFCPVTSAAKKKTVYKYMSDDKVTSFSDIEPINRDFTKITVDCYACKIDSTVDWYTTKLYLSEFRQYINEAALTHGVNPAFVRAIIHAESHFNKSAISKQGAQGLMQLMPKTAISLGVSNTFIAKENINGGVKHLAHLLKKYNGNKELVAAAYNAGEGAVKKYSGIPPYAETKVYVERVDILNRRYQRAIKNPKEDNLAGI